MKKLYIPTSSLNFNNIMSCEAISPVAFYSKRNFGYKIFEKVELNNFDNSVLLFDQFPDFHIPKSNMVNYPMIIEVDVNDIEKDGLKELKGGISQYDRTIYINPFSSKIYLVSDEHKNTILSRSESSAETKLVSLYLNSIKVYNGGKKKYTLKGVSDLPSLNMEEIGNDIQKNRIKGFAYSYIIAANNSISKDTVRIKNIVKKITNLSSAIVNSASGYGTSQQNDDLRGLLQQLDSQQYNDVKAYLKSVLPKEWGEVWQKLYFQFGLRMSSKYSYESYFPLLIDKTKYSSILQELNRWCENVEHENINSKPKFEWKNIALAANKLTQYEDTISNKPETIKMYKDLINDVFITTDVTESSFSSERSILADNITKKIKSYIGKEWDNSNAKKYLNMLRRNLAGQEEFNVKWDIGLISAIGAFILKGDDFEKLSDFLVSNEIEDGRLAFGFYGCICGFANLSRAYTSSFYNADIQYITTTYKTTFKQLHNIELEGVLPKEEKLTQEKKYPPTQEKESTENIIRETPPVVNKEEPQCPKCKSQMVLIEHQKGSFYGCPNYNITNCTGKRDLDFNELDDKFKIIKTSDKQTDVYKKLILEFLREKSPCRISDLNKYLSSKSSWSHNVGSAKDFIKEKLANEVKLIEIKQAKGVELRKDNLL
jgi:ssDNA-binding Zn-finger/Zn-ribbon topoisomerase 1